MRKDKEVIKIENKKKITIIKNNILKYLIKNTYNKYFYI